MKIGLDTNVLLRLFEREHPHYPFAYATLEELTRESAEVYVSMQVLTELWNAMTRPRMKNGLGWTVDVATSRIEDTLIDYTFLPDTTEVAETWLELVKSKSVIGKQVHDARLAAWVLAHGLDALVTFNGQDFKRYGIRTRQPE